MRIAETAGPGPCFARFRAAAATVETALFGRTLDCLVNNAGISTYGPEESSAPPSWPATRCPSTPAFSDSLRGELPIHGIDVIVVGPGMVQTPLFEKAQAIDLSHGQDTESGPVLRRMRDMPSESEKLALEPKYKLLMWFIPRWMPPRLLGRMMAKRFELPIREV